MLMFDFKRKLGSDDITEKIFPADVSALNDVLAFIGRQLEKANYPIKTVTQICVAIEEVFVNMAHYAYKDGKGDAKIAFGFDKSSHTATFVPSDSGVPLDPLQNSERDITLSADERKIGGLGMFITKKTMDNVSYRYENGENILTMTKKYKRSL